MSVGVGKRAWVDPRGSSGTWWLRGDSWMVRGGARLEVGAGARAEPVRDRRGRIALTAWSRPYGRGLGGRQGACLAAPVARDAFAPCCSRRWKRLPARSPCGVRGTPLTDPGAVSPSFTGRDRLSGDPGAAPLIAAAVRRARSATPDFHPAESRSVESGTNREPRGAESRGGVVTGRPALSDGYAAEPGTPPRARLPPSLLRPQRVSVSKPTSPQYRTASPSASGSLFSVAAAVASPRVRP